MQVYPPARPAAGEGGDDLLGGLVGGAGHESDPQYPGCVAGGGLGLLQCPIPAGQHGGGCVGQRLALLTIDLEQLKEASCTESAAMARELELLVRTAGEITTDVHNVSRRLHPSQVELLGLAPALHNFCREFAERNSMDIQFVSVPLTCRLQDDASLCLFRVAQEAVRNVQKHIGCSRALVELDEISGALRLRISDQGVGFDPTVAEGSQDPRSDRRKRQLPDRNDPAGVARDEGRRRSHQL